MTARRGTLVLGMHRSGTSMIADALTRGGLQGPRTPMPANEWNPAGYGESQILHDFHERLLQEAGTRWDSYEAIPSEWFTSDAAHRLRAECETLLAREFDLSQPFVLKDPRVCRFVPFWLQVLENCGVGPSVVLVLRHPTDVAASLEARDGLPRSVSLLAWLRHVLDAERHSRHLPRVIVRYDQALVESGEFRARLAKVTGAFVTSFASEVVVDAGTRLDLRHHAGADNRWETSSTPSEWLDRAWNTLLELTHEEAGQLSGAYSVLDAVRVRFDEEVTAFSADSRRLQNEAARDLERLGDALRSSENALRSSASARSSLELALQDERVQAEHARQHFAQERAGLQLHIEHLEAWISELRADLTGHASQMSRQMIEIARRADEIDRMHSDALAAQRQIAMLESECAALRTSFSWRLTAPLRHLARLVR